MIQSELYAIQFLAEEKLELVKSTFSKKNGHVDAVLGIVPAKECIRYKPTLALEICEHLSSSNSDRGISFNKKMKIWALTLKNVMSAMCVSSSGHTISPVLFCP